MKMTEKMKQSLLEQVKKEGLALSDEQLEIVAGGRILTDYESDAYYSRLEKEALAGSLVVENANKYWEYISTLPEGSPEVLYDPAVNYGDMLSGTAAKKSGVKAKKSGTKLAV